MRAFSCPPARLPSPHSCPAPLPPLLPRKTGIFSHFFLCMCPDSARCLTCTAPHCPASTACAASLTRGLSCCPRCAPWRWSCCKTAGRSRGGGWSTHPVSVGRASEAFCCAILLLFSFFLVWLLLAQNMPKCAAALPTTAKHLLTTSPPLPCSSACRPDAAGGLEPARLPQPGQRRPRAEPGGAGGAALPDLPLHARLRPAGRYVWVAAGGLQAADVSSCLPTD